MVQWSQYRYFVIGHNSAVEYLFQHKGMTKCGSIDAADIVVWTGGHDVDPSLYGENVHPKTHFYKKRDLFEKACYNRALSGQKSRLLVGICRGGQFLNVMNGGSLWQHVDKHAIHGEHTCWYRTPLGERSYSEQSFLVNSTHHQMMIPNGRNQKCEVWGSAGEATLKESGARLDEGKGDFFKIGTSPGHKTDTEIVFYPQTNSLCFQPHPEYTSRSTTDLFWTCVERALKYA